MKAFFKPHRLQSSFICRLFNASANFLACIFVAFALIACAGSKAPKPIELTAFIPTSSLGQLWQNTAGSAFNQSAQLAVSGTLVAAASTDGTVTVIDSTTGQDTWRYKLGAPVAGGIGFNGALIALTMLNNDLVAIKPASSAVLWRQRLTSRVYTPPVLAGGRVFVSASDRSLSAFDAQTGARLWTTNRPPEPLVLSQGGTLGVYKNTLLVGGSGRLMGVNPDNGQILWETSVAVTRATNDIERLIDLVGQPHRVGDSVCVRSYQAAVACVDVQKGLTVWTKNTQGASGVSGDAELVVSSESDGRVKLWNRSNGDLIWSIDSLAHRRLSAPLMVGNSIIVGDFEGFVHVLNKADGKFVVRFKTDGSAVISPPVISGNAVIVATAKGGIFAFSPQ